LFSRNLVLWRAIQHIIVSQALTPAFSQLLSELLYNQPDLRPPVLRALRTLVESNNALASQDKAQLERFPALTRIGIIAPEVAAQNIAFLRTQAESWLAVLFNVFGSVGRDARGMVGDVISAWVSIASDEVWNQLFDALA